MRQQPISRDEVRFNGNRITTLPLDSVTKGDEWWSRREPISGLWAPLLRSLNRKRLSLWKANADFREQAAKAGVRVSTKPPEPISAPYPYGFPCTCRHCGREFYRVLRSIGRYCCDPCAAAARAASRSAAAGRVVTERSAARAQARAGRACEQCGASLSAERSTRRFCTTRCRVTAHRQRG